MWLLFSIAAAQYGSQGCPCLAKADIDFSSVKVNTSDGTTRLQYTDADGTLDQIDYGVDYGLEGCKAYDTSESPVCTGDSPPEWCGLEFCFVDSSYCDVYDVAPSYFWSPDLYPELWAANPGGLYYSYLTCGEPSTFAKWAATKDMLAGQIKEEINKYIKKVTAAVEDKHVATLSEESLDVTCDYTDACSCSTCARQGLPGSDTGWGDLELDLTTLSVMHPPDGDAAVKSSREARQAQCLAKIVEREWEKTISREYNDKNRVAYMYYGNQDGMYFGWPAVKQSCPSTYDPRYRPWYVAAATGPKDVVIIVDFSGSMTTDNPSRWPAAQEAVVALLLTLSEHDYATLVGFSSILHSGMLDETPPHEGKVLLPMTDANKERIRSEVMDMEPFGGTDFSLGIKEAFAVLKNSAEQGQTSSCSPIFLFMTDGKDSAGKPVLEIIEEEQDKRATKAIIFTYAFGNALSGGYDLTKKMACQNEGIWYEIPDGGDLATTMSDYYKYFAAAKQATEPTWIQYDDSWTGARLISACLPAYDTTVNHVELLGVTCMDMNVMLSMTDLGIGCGRSCGKADRDAFLEGIDDDSKQCVTISHSEIDRQRIRGDNRCSHSDTNEPWDPNAVPAAAAGGGSSGGGGFQSAAAVLFAMAAC